jgi:amino-acid N-acetyltransferase
VKANEGDLGANDVDIRQATRADDKNIRSLLRSCDLPDDDIGHHLPNFVVAGHEGRIVGTIGLEVLGSSALLRSLAVAVPARGAGLATGLVEVIVTRARRLGVRELWLLTTTAEGFFANLGFRSVARNEAPPEIRSTREFRVLCPDSAILMRHRIDPIGPGPVTGTTTTNRSRCNEATGQENGG